jgi:catechol 2,3-dioxygenase-like lactoylglutathione lyase family enzyme
MIKVRRLGHATISTPDMDGQIDYYGSILGLRVAEQSKDRAILVSKQGLEAVELVRGEKGQLKRLSFQIAPGTDLNDVVKELGKLGIKSEKRSGISPGIAEAVTLTDPKGTPIDLYAEYKFYEAAQPGYFNLLKLGHVAYRVLDVQQIVKFYSEVLGFRVSDWRGDFFVFMRCNTDHHTLNFIIDEKPQLHHIAFEVFDWSEINKAGDWLARNKIHLVWGPGRHVIGHNVATYHRNSDLVRVEIFTEMDQLKDEALGYFDPRPWHQEFPLYPKMHGPETLRNYWGYGSERVIQGYQTNELPQYEAIRG